MEIESLFPQPFFMPALNDNEIKAVVSALAPSVLSVLENKSHYEITLLVPGWKASDFKVKVQQGMLIVEAGKEDRIEDQEQEYVLRDFTCRLFSWSYHINKLIYDLTTIYDHDKLYIRFHV